MLAPETRAWSMDRRRLRPGQSSAALPVHTKKLWAGQINCCEAEPAVAADPLANWHWIDVPKRACGGIINDLEAKKARTPGGVKTEHRVLRNTNSIRGHNAEHERTGRRTGAINNDLLTGITKCHIARPICADIATAIICDADSRNRGFGQQPWQHQDERHCERDLRAKHGSADVFRIGKHIVAVYSQAVPDQRWIGPDKKIFYPRNRGEQKEHAVSGRSRASEAKERLMPRALACGRRVSSH